MVTTLIMNESLHVFIQFGDRQFAFIVGQGNHPVARGFDSRSLMHVDVACVNGNDSLVGTQHTINDRSIGLRATGQEEDVSIGGFTGHPDFLPGLFAIYIKTIRGRDFRVGFQESLHHLRMCAVVVITFK